jgi:hypothetical protein
MHCCQGTFAIEPSSGALPMGSKAVVVVKFRPWTDQQY